MNSVNSTFKFKWGNHMFKKLVVAAVANSFTLTASVSYAGTKAEVHHWWTSGGEAKSVAVLQKEFSENGG